MNLEKYFISIPKDLYSFKKNEFSLGNRYNSMEDSKKIIEYLMKESYTKWTHLSASIPIMTLPDFQGYKAFTLDCVLAKQKKDLKVSSSGFSAMQIEFSTAARKAGTDVWILNAFCTEDDDWFWVNLGGPEESNVVFGVTVSSRFNRYYRCDGVLGFLKLIEQIDLIPKKEDLLR